MLYHFSEEQGITRFEPREMDSRPGEPPRVWAITTERAPNYLFPRECPRVCFWPNERTTEDDVLRFFGHSDTRYVIAVESRWLDSIRSAKLYRYSFESGPFALEDTSAGYYTTTETVVPVAVEPVGDLLDAILAAGVELRITPSLTPIRQAILQSTVDFSMIRLRNARL